MFTHNKYHATYFKLVESRQNMRRVKARGDGLSKHHIIPRSCGGDNLPTNIVLLTYKEHRLAHKLLVRFTTGKYRWKMQHALKLFDRKVVPDVQLGGWTSESRLKSTETRKHNGSYRRGSDNVFASDRVKAVVKDRMLTNNPMKRPEQRERMRQDNHKNRPIVTPAGTFVSRAAALRHHNFKHWKVLYDLMTEHPDQYYWLENSSL